MSSGDLSSKILGPLKTRSLSFSLLCVLRSPSQHNEISLAELLEQLGDRSFGWAILLSSLINLLPLPPGATLVTAIPLVVFCAQLGIGRSCVWLPSWIGNRLLSRLALRRTILRLRPISRRLERLARPRMQTVFQPKRERLVGVFFFCVALALFVPLPLSGWFPAISLFVAGIGLIERDGLIVIAGVCLGVFSIGLTIFVTRSILVGAESLMN